ncbi:lipopolysaccharide-induced tumor necrosis factor-alpha factor homolog isoform X2 [Syngnathus acus]|uniref:lipopolysaccharide-induced tumor necrosis factor-alpha factor homolog isoform X2 n=1 Tax=Syngnathus acus TaxID=161584 RepID=UPI001885D0BB|nr:lipopolysaccharide-induced tumor necrosis factor-alpha factor homolog isoform X2 [Syngnathus acus]XP_037114836.1 lipopolysaccharide-induced tumor necrosis factor-alpha factor homolog isoform X2 [Syngnathus acus]
MKPPSYAEATLRPPPPATSQTPSEAPPSYEETINAAPGRVVTTTHTSQVFTRQPREGTLQPGPISILGSPIVTSQVSYYHSGVVNVQPDPFPVLRTPIVTTADTSRVFIHPPVEVGQRRHQARRGGGAHAAPVQVVVVTQPQPQQTISITRLRNHPGYVRCSKCHYKVTTVKVLCPSSCSFFACIMILVGCFFCGCCLIPFCIPSCWNVYHYCPRCRKCIYVYDRGGYGPFFFSRISRMNIDNESCRFTQC